MPYNVAQICKNGHLINYRATEYSEDNESFCDFCGAETITECLYCNEPIRGALLNDRFADQRYSLEGFPIPRFCLNCGKPFPWTETAIEAAKELAYNLDLLDEPERVVLANSIDDLVKESPKTQVASVRFKRIMTKVGAETYSMFKEILTSVAAETAKKMLFPGS